MGNLVFSYPLYPGSPQTVYCNQQHKRDVKRDRKIIMGFFKKDLANNSDGNLKQNQPTKQPDQPPGSTKKTK